MLELPMLDPQISDAKPGIGTIKFALNALPDGLWIMEFVFQFPMTVLNTTKVELVLPATKDTDLKMEFV